MMTLSFSRAVIAPRSHKGHRFTQNNCYIYKLKILCLARTNVGVDHQQRMKWDRGERIHKWLPTWAELCLFFLNNKFSFVIHTSHRAEAERRAPVAWANWLGR
jgi:hypothetical protein